MALRDQTVDLWPLITLMPERSGYIHFTEPYLETEHCFLVRAESDYTETHDLAGALISHNGVRINERNLRVLLPNARLLASRGISASMENVCQHRADAAFVEEYTAVSAFLGGLSCAGQELRLILVPEIRPRLSVGSTFAASAAADAIREEISEIASEANCPPPVALELLLSPQSRVYPSVTRCEACDVVTDHSGEPSRWSPPDCRLADHSHLARAEKGQMGRGSVGGHARRFHG